MEPITVHSEGREGEPISVTMDAEVLADGSLRFATTPEIEGTFSHQGREYQVTAGEDIARPVE